MSAGSRPTSTRAMAGVLTATAAVLCTAFATLPTAAFAAKVNVNLGLVDVTVDTAPRVTLIPPPPPQSHSTSCAVGSENPLQSGSFQETATDLTTGRHLNAVMVTGTRSADLPTIRYASVDWGDGSFSPLGSGPNGTVTIEYNGQSYTIRGEHTYASGGVHHASVYTNGWHSRTSFEVPFADVFGAQCNIAFDVTVIAGVVGQGVIFPATLGAEYNGQVARFSDDLDANAVPANYTAYIFWGDGYSNTGTIRGIETANGRRTFSVSGRHTYEGLPRTQEVSVLIVDEQHTSTAIRSQANISSPFPGD